MAIYQGTAPESPDDVRQDGILSEATLLVEAAFNQNGRAFNDAAAGVALAYPLASGTAVATGDAEFFLCYSSDGHPVMQGLVGKSDSDLKLSDVSIRTGATVSITSFQYRQAG